MRLGGGGVALTGRHAERARMRRAMRRWWHAQAGVARGAVGPEVDAAAHGLASVVGEDGRVGL